MAWQDYMSDTHAAAPHEGRVNPSGNTTADPEEENLKLKLKWRPCRVCHAQGEGFRLACLSYGQTVCRICTREAQESAERLRFRMTSGELEKAADKLLQKAGCGLSWKRGGKQIKIK